MGFLNDSLSGLINKITGTGTSRDKAVNVGWHFERPSDAELLRLYRSTWIARKLVNIPIDDMLREGWTWVGDQNDITALEAEERRLGIKAKLHEVLVRDALYGGGALIIGDGSDTTQPLVQVRRGGLQYLMVTGRGELIIEDIERDPGLEYGKPTMFQFMLQNGQLLKIHPSRVITFVSNPVPSAVDTISFNDYWGDSRLASMMRDIAAASSGVTGIGRLMEELAVVYHKIAGLTERLSDADGEDAVRKMLNLISHTKSSLNMAAIDSEDDFEVVTANFTGFPEALRTLMQNVAGAADIPLTRFLGSSPDGLNATGASDTRNYYDRLAGDREKHVVSGVGYLDQFLIQSTFGRPRDDVWRTWNPLWQLSETEQVDLDAKKMTMMKEISGAMLVHDHVTEQVTRSMMIDSPTFQGAEGAFEEADKLPEPNPEDVETANALQAGGPKLRLAGGTDLRDMAPTPLYVRRDVLNAAEILAWAKAQGIPELMPASELHVTVLYSKAPVDWFQMGQSWQDKVEIGKGGPRALEVFGEGALVLRFSADELRWRHESMLEKGASSDYPEYSPHITLSYGAAGIDTASLEPYQGRIVLGPEIFEEIKEEWQFGDVKAWHSQPRHPAGSKFGGQWSGGPSAANCGPQMRVVDGVTEQWNEDKQIWELDGR